MLVVVLQFYARLVLSAKMEDVWNLNVRMLCVSKELNADVEDVRISAQWDRSSKIMSVWSIHAPSSDAPQVKNAKEEDVFPLKIPAISLTAEVAKSVGKDSVSTQIKVTAPQAFLVSSESVKITA